MSGSTPTRSVKLKYGKCVLQVRESGSIRMELRYARDSWIHDLTHHDVEKLVRALTELKIYVVNDDT
jgi:hypothetical protein